MSDVNWFVTILVWLLNGTVIFAVFERRGKVDGPIHTLSRAVWDLFEAFPLAIIAGALQFGMLVGGLTVHFFWHWCPPGSTNLG